MFQLWRENCWRLAVIFLLVIFSGIVSGIRINEVMPHANNSLGDEWIELYNTENLTLTLSNWKIGDKVSNDTVSLNISAYGFAIVTDSSIGCANFNIPNENCIELATIGSSLNDDEENLYLYDNSSLVDSFSWSVNIKSSGNSWQLYNSIWQACQPTPAKENFCQQQNQTQNNQTNQTSQNQTSEQIYLKLNYDEKIENGREFDIKVKAYNLKDEKYDIKIYIAFENGSVMSETYDRINNRWGSSNYYADELIEGPGNKSETLRLRIDPEYKDFGNDAKIVGRIRLSGESSYITDIKEDIRIWGRGEVKEEEGQISGEITGLKEGGEENIIRLDKPKNIKTDEGLSAVYKSKTQYIKEYAIYGFALFCVFIIILMLIKRFKI